MKRNKNPYPGVTPITDRHGKRRYRFRKKGKPSCYIQGEYGSEQFIKEYEAAMSGTTIPVVVGRAATFGTFDWLIAKYKTTAKYAKIGKTYKKNLNHQFDRFSKVYGQAFVKDLHERQVEKIIAKKADTPASANELLKLLSRLSRYAIKLGLLEKNPTLDVKPYATNEDGYYTWTEGNVNQFEEHHGVSSMAVRAERILRCTGASRQDAVKLGWQNIKGERFEYRRGKTGQLVSLELRLIPELIEALNFVSRDQLLFITHGGGNAYKPTSFGNWFKDQCKAAGLLQCSAHGLRKAGATRMAEAGANEMEIMAFLGHSTPDEARTYVKKADRKRLADNGLAKLLNQQNASELKREK